MVQASDTVWLSVLPDMSGFGPGIVKGAGKEVDKQGRVVGGRFGGAIVAGVAAVGAGAAAAGAALYNIGSTFDEMSDAIAIGTGAVGADLDGLVESAKNVGREVPVNFEVIGDALTSLNTHTGSTGEVLEGLTASITDASRMLGEDGAANADAFGRSLTQWQRPAEDGEAILDSLFVLTQDYGVGLNETIGHLNTYGSVLQNAGFTMEESAGLFSQLEAGGIAVSRVMPGLNASFRTWADEGKNSREELERSVTAIRDTEDAQEALSMATEVFGAEGAQRMTTAIRNGTLELEDLTGAMDGAEGSIASTSEETASFSEKWELFKNNIMAELEPAATAVFDALGDGITWLTDTAFPAMKNAWNDYVQPVLSDLWTAFQEDIMPVLRDVGETAREMWEDHIQPALSDLWGTIQDDVLPVLTDLGDRATTMWEDHLQPAFESIWQVIEDDIKPTVLDLWENVIKPAFTEIGDIVRVAWEEVIEPALSDLETFIQEKLIPTVMWLWEEVIGPAFAGIGNIIDTAWNEVVKPIFDAIKAVLEGDLSGAFDFLQDAVEGVFQTIGEFITTVWETVIKPVFDALGNWIEDNVVPGVQAGVDMIRDAWYRVGNFFREPINFVINAVWNDGIKWAFDSVADAVGLPESVRLPTAPTIPHFGPSGRDLTGHIGGPRARARGGYTPPGWTLVGEEGPELIDLRTPGMVYTADETAQMFNLTGMRDLTPHESQVAAGSSPADAVLPMGPTDEERALSVVDGLGRGGVEAAGEAVQWVRGRLADAANAVLNPLLGLVDAGMSGFGKMGGLGSGIAHDWADTLVDWIRGHDEEHLARQMQSAGSWGGETYDGPFGGWTRPHLGPITSHFGPRWGGSHSGTDLGGVGPVFAAGAGRVMAQGWNLIAGRSGLGMLLNHGAPGSTYYGHLTPGSIIPSVGQDVFAGQHIATSGSTGNVTGPHLHFEYLPGSLQAPVNPMGLGVFDTGGQLDHNAAAVNFSGKPEAILTGTQWQDIHTLAMKQASSGPQYAGPMVHVDNYGGDVGDMVGALNFEMQRRGWGARARMGVSA